MPYLKNEGTKALVDAIKYIAETNVWNPPETGDTVDFVKHYRLSNEEYQKLVSSNKIDKNALYFITDSDKHSIYMGKELYSGGSGGGNVDNELSLVSVNPVQNKVITEEINKIKESFQDISGILDDRNGEVITEWV